MHTPYHRQITIEALQELFSPDALEQIISANLGQDNLRGQIGHDEYHFDANAFPSSREYIASNRLQVHTALKDGNVLAARQAFGRLTHTAQDFYAHSNYVKLWLERFSPDGWPAPGGIDALDQSLLTSPDLRSGKLYYPLEAFSYIRILKKYILPLLPHDSHAWMNLDTPEQGMLFHYGMAAAVKRTRYEYELTVNDMPQTLTDLFRG
jgi:hypothetical protein